jgi:hypothetical protein
MLDAAGTTGAGLGGCHSLTRILMLHKRSPKWVQILKGSEGEYMQIIITEVDARAKHVTLKGRLDIAVMEAIGVPLAAGTATRGNVILDMAGVDFITSVGIRHLCWQPRR